MGLGRIKAARGKTRGEKVVDGEKYNPNPVVEADRNGRRKNCERGERGAIDREIKSSLLCQALTEQRLKIRVLRYSLQAEVPVTSMFCATGNNLVVSADLCRRTLLCRLDAKMERPETRSFKRNVLEIVRSERPKLVAAALTVLRAWHMARTAIGVEPFGSFEDWSYRIRQPLLWLDQADPAKAL